MMACPHSWLLRIMDSTVSYLRSARASLNWYSLVSICSPEVAWDRGTGYLPPFGYRGGHAFHSPDLLYCPRVSILKTVVEFSVACQHHK